MANWSPPQLVDLGVNFPVYGFVAVAAADRHYAPEKIKILVAVGIPDVLIFGSVNNQRLLKQVKH